jgi:hypothetical protein
MSEKRLSMVDTGQFEDVEYSKFIKDLLSTR